MGVVRVNVGDLTAGESMQRLRTVRGQYQERWLMQHVSAATEDLFVPYWRCAFCDAHVKADRERCGECGASRPGRV
jgi:hypothetical protein